MNAHSNFRRTATALIVAALAMIAAQTVSAQPVFSNPPCPGVKVVNRKPGCTAQIRFVTVPAGVWPAVINLPSGASVGLPNPVPGVTVTGVTDIFGTFYPFNAPPGPITGCGPTGWWITGIALAPALACIYNVCADPATCTITFS